MPKGAERCPAVRKVPRNLGRYFRRDNSVIESGMLPKGLRHRSGLYNFKEFRECLTSISRQHSAVSGQARVSGAAVEYFRQHSQFADRIVVCRPEHWQFHSQGSASFRWFGPVFIKIGRDPRGRPADEQVRACRETCRHK